MDEKRGESTFLEEQMNSKPKSAAPSLSETGRRVSMETTEKQDVKVAEHEDFGELTEAELADLAGAPIFGSSSPPADDNESAGSEKTEMPRQVTLPTKPLTNTEIPSEATKVELPSTSIPRPKFAHTLPPKRKQRSQPSKKDPAKDHIAERLQTWNDIRSRVRTKSSERALKLGTEMKPTLRGPRRSSTRSSTRRQSSSSRADGEVSKKTRSHSNQRTQSNLVMMEDQRIERLEQKFANNTVVLDIGGKSFSTTYATITKDPGSRLAKMLRNTLESGTWKDHFFVDRDPSHFRHILNFLRQGPSYFKDTSILDGPTGILSELKQEASYYKIKTLSKYLIEVEKQYTGKRRASRTRQHHQRSRSQGGSLLKTKAFSSSGHFTPSKSIEDFSKSGSTGFARSGSASRHMRSGSSSRIDGRVMPLSAQNLALHSGGSNSDSLSLSLPFDARSQASDFSEFTDLESVASENHMKNNLNNILSTPKQSIMLKINIDELQTAAAIGDFAELERIIGAAADHHYKGEQERVLKFQQQLSEENERKKVKMKQYKEKVTSKAKKIKAQLAQQKRALEKQRSSMLKDKHEMLKKEQELQKYVKSLPDEDALIAKKEFLDREQSKLHKALTRLEESRKENTLEKERVREIKKSLEENIRALKDERQSWTEEREQFQQKQLQQEKEKAELKKALMEIERDRSALEEETSKTADLSSEIEQKQSIINETSEKLEQKLLQTERERQELLFRLEQFEKEKAKFERDREELQYQIDNHKKYNLEKADLESKKMRHQEHSKDLDDKQRLFEKELREFEKEKEGVRERESELAFREARLSGNQEVLEREKAVLDTDKQALSSEREKLNKDLEALREERTSHLEELKRLSSLRDQTKADIDYLNKKQDQAEEVSRTSLLLQNRLHLEQSSMDSERESLAKDKNQLSEELEKLRMSKLDSERSWQELRAAKVELASERSKAQKELDTKKEKVELDLNLLQSETFKLQKLKLETDDILREKENLQRLKMELESKQTEILRKEVDIEFAMEALKRDKDSLASKERILEVQSTELQARTKEIQEIKSAVLRQQSEIEERRRQSELDLSSERQKWERKNQTATHMAKQAETDKIQLESALKDMKTKMEEHNSKMHKDMSELSRKRREVEEQLRRAAESENIRLQLDRDEAELNTKKAKYQAEEELLKKQKMQWEKINNISAGDISALQEKIDDLQADNAHMRNILQGKDDDLERRMKFKDEEIQDLQNQINQLNLEIIDLSNQDEIHTLKLKVEELTTELKNEKNKPNLGEMSERSANKFIKAQWRRLEDERNQLKQRKQNLNQQEKDLKRKQAKIKQQQLDVNRWQTKVERSSRQVESIESQMKLERQRRSSLLNKKRIS